MSSSFFLYFFFIIIFRCVYLVFVSETKQAISRSACSLSLCVVVVVVFFWLGIIICVRMGTLYISKDVIGHLEVTTGHFMRWQFFYFLVAFFYFYFFFFSMQYVYAVWLVCFHRRSMIYSIFPFCRFIRWKISNVVFTIYYYYYGFVSCALMPSNLIPIVRFDK